MKITFLGVSGALTGGFSSNMFLETEEGCGVLIDCGEDIKIS